MRYFLISVFFGKDKFGQIVLETDGEHPSYNNLKNDFSDERVVILNIHEFKDKKDFDDFKQGITIK